MVYISGLVVFSLTSADRGSICNRNLYVVNKANEPKKKIKEKKWTRIFYEARQVENHILVSSCITDKI